MWEEIDAIRNRICGYDELPTTQSKANSDRARIGMLRLYAKRRAMGLNSRGQPYKVKERKNKRYEL